LSRTVKKIFAMVICDLINASLRLPVFENKNNSHIREHKINNCGFWQYIEVLLSKMIGLCKKLNIIYDIITCNS